MTERGVSYLDGRLAPRAHAALPGWLAEGFMFLAKLLWSALFAVLILGAIIISRLIWQHDWVLARYDALVIFVVATQILFLVTRLESWEEAKVIFLFHVTGTVMEIFKLAQGSWDYPEQGILEIGGVPLFTGFMYAAVGSFIARAIRIFHMQFAPYPAFPLTFALALAIYVNFFTHHYVWDIRWVLFAATIALYWRTRIWFFPARRPRWVPLPAAAAFAALLLWVAENVGTLTQTWAYPGQGAFQLVNIAKFGSWYLLLYVSFVTVTLVLRDALIPHPVRPTPR
ncbi:DUF817 domain-containing protein [Hasllibacter sp. MH4015]|uniref:DUF817 domain-containing protein n=1 Tax=Hasllibacter sp. MH4015 TaxID=2854029 RepID=UPI001CD43F40|nr:DUF817 domain-containing protein [Hasllibacter sp. MH4015]